MENISKGNYIDCHWWPRQRLQEQRWHKQKKRQWHRWLRQRKSMAIIGGKGMVRNIWSQFWSSRPYQVYVEPTYMERALKDLSNGIKVRENQSFMTCIWKSWKDLVDKTLERVKALWPQSQITGLKLFIWAFHVQPKMAQVPNLVAEPLCKAQGLSWGHNNKK